MLAEFVHRLMKSRSIEENQLYIVDIADARDTCSCSLGLAADGSYFLAHDGIEKRGLSCVGASCDSYKGCSGHQLLSPFTTKVASLEIPSFSRTDSSFSRIMRWSS